MVCWFITVEFSRGAGAGGVYVCVGVCRGVYVGGYIFSGRVDGWLFVVFS